VTPGGLLLFSAIGLALAIVIGPRWPRAWLVLTVAGALAGVAAAMNVLVSGADWEWRSGFLLGGETLHFRLDGVSALFLALSGVVGGAGAVYAREYWGDVQFPTSAPRGRRWWSGLLLSIGGVLVASNSLHFLFAWEMFTVCAYFLVTLDRSRRNVRAAGWLYLAASHVGTICLFAFFCAVAARTGSWDLGPMRERTELAPLFWLVLIGFGVKGGVFPLHVWLPSAHASAPSHVSAILSGVAIKMGIYGIVRFSGWLPLPAEAGWVIIGLGTAGALIGIAFALAQEDLKRLLAYSSVENVGVIMIGLGMAILGAKNNEPWGGLALAGALLHVWNHGLFKSLLFFGAGSVLHATGTREMSRLGGLWRMMPWTAACFATGAMAVSALPPFNGFVSEWLVYLGLFDAARGRGPASWAAMLAAISLGMTGALALASFVKASAIVFLGTARTRAASDAHECGRLMRVPMIVLATLCLGIGLAPAWCWPLIARAAGAWRPVPAGADMSAPLAALGGVHVALAALLVFAVALLWTRVRSVGLRRAPTWGCGFATPTSRMQYTSGAFAASASRWFSALLQREYLVRRPRGVFPGSAIYLRRVPEAVLERIVEPVARAVIRVSTLVRRLQHGRLQFYIVYVVAGLAAIGALVALEAR
jgi:hydrogenase-4 component B